MFHLSLKAVLDDEVPTRLPRTAGIALQAYYQLFELVPGENLGLLGESPSLGTLLLRAVRRVRKLCHIRLA